jgi:hypothetical protein
MDYVHSHMPNAYAGEDHNLPASGPISATNPRPVPTLGRVVMAGLPNTRSWYDALEMQVRQRVRGANSLQVSYTLSRALLDGCSGVCISGVRAFQRDSIARLEATGRSLEYGYNPTDSRHNLAISASLALPVGLQLSGIARVISAPPLLANCGGCDIDGDTIADRAPGTALTVGRGDLNSQLAAINAFRASRNLAPLTLSQIKIPPPAKNIDVRLTKQLNVGGGRRMELFAEAFNITNFVNTTGQAQSVLLSTFNVPIGAQDARQVQWGARYSF